MKKSRLIIIGLFLSIFPVFFNGQHVQAYTYKHGQNTTLDKIVAKNFTKAFSIMKDKISLYEAVGQNNHPFWWYAIDRNKIDSCGSVAMPNTIIEGGSLTCEEFLIGKGDEWSGLFPHEEIGPRREKEATAYYGKIGYTLEKVAAKKSTERSCLKAEIVSLDKGTEYSVNNICLINGRIDTTAVSNMKNGDRYFDIDGYGCATFRNYPYSNNILGSSSNNAVFCDYNSLEDLQKLFQEQANFLKGSISYDYNFKIESAENKGTQSDSMKKGTQSTVMKKIIGQKTVKTLSTLEVYNLYYQYINNSNNVELRCDSKYDFKSRSEEWHHVIIKNNGKIDNNCYVREKRSISYSLAAPTSNAYTIDGKKNKNRQYLFSETGKSLKDLAKAINALDLKSILSKAKDIKSTEDKKASEDQSPAEKDEDCYDAGVESMSWIICPAIDNTSNTVDGIESIIRGMLSIDANQMFKDNDTTYTIWNVFRNIANVAIIIVFLIIIFSQLTGVGIDNYGIKKMLPKLIIMAILINLSYVICQIAVDLSNILGVGLNNLFESVASNAGKTSSTTSDIAGALITAAAVAAGAGAVAAGAISVVGVISGGGVMIIISLILALLVALVAVLMFFVMLGARMIIVIVFTVIAPVAFALYILPNTQNLFKKWWKIFQAALVVFPICGALYGASFIIKAITIGQGDVNFVMALAAVCAPFLPFLLLPSLLKGALAGLGALGGAITMMGSGLKKGLSRGNDALKGTDRYKAAQEKNQERRIQRRAGINRNGEEIKMGRVGRFMRGGERGIARARAQYAKNLESKNRENDMMGAGFSAVLAGVESKADAQRVADAESLLRNNKVSGVNANDASSVGGYHARLLADYQNAQNEADKAAILTRIKAAQNILSKTDTGRTQVQDNLERAVRGGQTEGLSQAAAHLLGEHGDKYKSANRGAHAMISDLATRSTNDVQAKINGGDYDKAGVNKYTEESIANADEGALQRLVGSMGSMSQAERDTLAETAYKALNNPNIHTQPAVEKQLKALSAGYTPPAAPPQMISHGAYEDPAGNVYHLREMNNGKYLDDSGFEVDITHFKKR